MSEVIVYLPMVHHAQGGESPVFLAHDVYNALDEAGIKWVQETADQAKVRIMEAELNAMAKRNAAANAKVEGLESIVVGLNDKCESLEQAARQWMNHAETARKSNDAQGEVIKKLEAEIFRLKSGDKA